MLDDKSKETVEPPFFGTNYVPIRNITNNLYLIFFQKVNKDKVRYIKKIN